MKRRVHAVQIGKGREFLVRIVGGEFVEETDNVS
jgi:hypothetical protein